MLERNTKSEPDVATQTRQRLHVEPETGTAAIIIAAFRCERWIKPCLDSLVESIDERHHIYVVDNGENNGAVPLTLPFANYTVLKTEQTLGFAEANNFALVRLNRPFHYICFLNQDTVSSPGWLDCCIECMESDSTIGAMMPIETLYNGTGIDPACGDCLKKSTSTTMITTSFGDLNVTITPQITAAAMVVRANIVAQIGPFDPIFESYCEDYDLGDRIISSGHTLGICHGPIVAHYSTSASASALAQTRRQALSLSNRIILECRRSPKSRKRVLMQSVLYLLPRRLLAAVFRRPGAPSFASIQIGYGRILKHVHRLISADADARAFESYLSTIEWKSCRTKWVANNQDESRSQCE